MKDAVMLLPAVVAVAMFVAGCVFANPLLLFLILPSALVCGAILAVIDQLRHRS